MTNSPVVLLPGLHGTTGLLRPLMRELEARRPAIAVDFPDAPMLTYEDLVGFVQARVPDGPFSVLGESFSGPLAITIAARAPERVTALILASTFARYPLPRLVHPATVWLSGLPVPPDRSARVLAGKRASPALVGDLASLIARLPPPLIRHRVRLSLHADVSNLLASTTCPLLYLAGRRDRLTGRRALASITGARPDAEVCRLDAGHMLLETHAKEAAGEIARFLDGG